MKKNDKKKEISSKKETIIKEKVVSTKKQEGIRVEKVLIENFVSLQHIMANLAVKFDNLSGQISKLLELFEISAKTLAEKDYSGSESDKKLTEKLDGIIEQNKVIARGISLLHERDSEPQYPPVVENRRNQPMQRMPSEFPRNPKFDNMA
jgi:hypothetical protein